MILEIALGIVLAVVILAFWQVILGLGLILLVVAIVLIAAGLAILWAVKDSESFGIVVAVVGGIFLIMWFARFMSKKRSGSNTNDEEGRRRSLGYGDSPEMRAGSGANDEEQRRRALGYYGSADEKSKRS